MYYAIYKKIRDCSWQSLYDGNVDSLPIDVLKIARESNVRVIKDSVVKDLLPDQHAKTYYDGKKWIIIYNDKNDIATSRFAIAHELGHISMMHATTHAKYANVREFGKKPKYEEQADMFALRLLSPACILNKMNVVTPERISEVCKIPLSWAKIRSKRIKELQKRELFLADGLEKKVYDRFFPTEEKETCEE